MSVRYDTWKVRYVVRDCGVHVCGQVGVLG